MHEPRQELPEDLEVMPPGPQLAALLASVDRRRLSERDRVRLVQARNRLVSHQQAELLADIYALSRDESPEHSLEHTSRYPWTELELAFALRWTRVAAGRRLEQARQLVEDLPAVQAALAAGEIDPPKAYLIADLAGWLDDVPAARAVVDKVIEQAPRLTTGQLRARLRRLILAIDPQAASRRCAKAVATRRVDSFDNPDGSGELWGRNLPPQDAAAAWERLTAIARSAKTTGDTRSMDQLRADALLDLLVGEGIALGDPVGYHTAGLPDAEPEAAASPAGLAAEGQPAEGLAAEGQPVEVGWDPEWPCEPMASAGPDDRPDDPALAAAAGHRPRPCACVCTGGAAGPVGPPPRRGTVDVQVPLVTLLGLAELPGELGGWGPVVADIARQIATEQTDGTWRVSIYDRLGELAYQGITRKRPTAEVDTFVRTRDHTCVAPGCRRPAAGCDLDHTVPKSRGGDSGPSNLGALCRRHHRLKHSAGAELIQSSPGCFGWTTPRGMQYVTTPHRPLLTI